MHIYGKSDLDQKQLLSYRISGHEQQVIRATAAASTACKWNRHTRNERKRWLAQNSAFRVEYTDSLLTLQNNAARTVMVAEKS